MKKFNKFLATVMVVVMVLTAAPLNGLVGLNLPDIFGFFASAVIESGTFGTNNALTWQFNSETKEFTVSGTGTMPYYASWDLAPWADFRDEIVTVTIGEGVTSVGSYSFKNCTSLKNVYISNTVHTISYSAFERTSIESIVIPDSVTHILSGAFRHCELLESIKLSDNLNVIENFAFDNCKSLTSLTFPASVTNILCDFKSCSSLTEIIVEEGNTNYVSDEYGVLYTASFAALKAYPVASVRESYTVNEATETIAKDAFSYNENLKTVILPEGVEKIQGDAFYSCKMLETVVIPTTVTTIGTDTDAFGNCASLKNVTFTGTQEEWDALDVQFPDSTPEVICAGKSGTTGSNATWRFNGVTGEFTVSGTGTMSYYTTSNPAPWTDFRDEIVTVTIEEGIKNVSSESFYRCTSLKNVNLPDTVTTIGGCAFEKTAIESIVIPDSVTHIDNAAFRGCKLLENVKLSANLRTIELFAFDDCESLTSLTIPASVTSIVCSFKSCSSLTEIIVEEGNTNYVSDEYGVLYTASFAALKAYPVASVRESYTVNEATETIAKNAFSYNENLKTVILPEGVEKIQGDAFYSCKMLETVVIPTTVTTIGTDTDAFGNCASLKNVTYNGSEHDWMLIYDNELQNLDGVTYNFLSQAENGGHTYELITDIQPTETQHGEKAYSCSCGMSYSELLHNYIVDPNMPEVPPTCNSNGKRYYICTVCGDEDAEMLEKTGEHKHVMNRITKMPTATTRGVKEGSCIYCGSVKGERIEATGFEWDESMIIDFLTYTVTGLNPGLTSLESLTNVVKDNCVWTYDTAYSRLGTGSKAILMHEDEVVQEYTILIYGDVDGNGWRDANDAFLVNMIANGLIDPYYLDETVRKAADCNRDDIINELDFELLVWAALKLDEIDMNASHAELVTQTAYIEYLSIFDQSFTPDIAPEADGTTDDDNVENGTDGSVTGIEAIITSIFEFIKKILSFIFLAIV